MQSNINETDEANKMFDHLLIFGQSFQSKPTTDNKTNNNYSPSLLCAYPSTINKKTPEELKQIKTFCFPDGFSELKSDENEKLKSIKIIDKFTFFFKELNQKKNYVACVEFSLYNESLSFFVNRMNKHFPFCMCMISKKPFISEHIRFMIQLIYILFGKSQPHKSLPPIPKYSNVNGLCYPSLIFDKNFMSVAVQKGIKVPKIFMKEILYYEHQKTENLTPALSLLYPTIHTLLSFLSLEKLVKLYTAVLLERKILFVSKKASKYSSSVIALSSLSSCFNTITLFLPIVPKKFAVLLDSPIPYIAGSSFYNNNADIVVDLDKDLFITKEEDPSLPSQDELIKKLSFLIDYEKKSITIPQKTIETFFNLERKSSRDFLEFVEKIDDYTYPISNTEDLKVVVNSETTDLIKVLFDGHVFPRLANFAKCIKKSNFLDETNDKMKKSYSKDINFYHDFFSTQCGLSLFDKYKDNNIDLFKLIA